MILVILTIFLFVLYGALISYYWLGWNAFPDFTAGNQEMNTAMSIIIPARNEEENIAQLLKALEEQSYPKDLFEVIVVDDHSTDQTAAVVQQFRSVTLIQLKNGEINSYKKKAIGEGIAAAKNPFIVTTDADCIPAPQWLRLIASFKQENNSVFVAAPVTYNTRKISLLSVFQALDFLVLQGITAVSVQRKFFAMCNGANLGYDKKIFYQVGGFAAIDKIASGDDMLLMQKIHNEFPQKVHYLKSKQAIVSTEPASSWKNLFYQRLRWASKARHYDDANIFLVELLVYVFNLFFLVLLIASFWDHRFLFWLLALWFSKTIIEFPFVYSVASWFNQRSLLKWFFFVQPLHIVCTIIVGFLAQFIKYEWKGRRVH
jgi:cellulose synthase/poly-beta-1,6-N-acetylglucosamine synthase-like glycosyltransferase